MNIKLNAIDLFSGCGGFSYGFQEAGINIILGVDNNDTALKTFSKNHDNSKTLNIDLHLNESIDLITEVIGDNNIDIIIAGPPCQGFSLTGTRDINDKRNTLFLAVFKLVEIIKPKAIVIENVPGLLTLYNGKAKTEILRLCEEFGYSCCVKVLYAPDYGIPQIRKRAFFVALQKEYGTFEFPSETHRPDEYITCIDAIGDLPSLENEIGAEIMQYDKDAFSQYQINMRKGSSSIFNHIGTQHSEHVINVIKQVPEGGNHKDLPPGVGDSRKFNEAWTRYHSLKPSKTIDTGHRNHFHYKWNRVPTARENARLQSFPDSFIFVGNKTEQYRQIGNAVPPLLGYNIAKQLLRFLNNKNEK